MRSRGVAVIAVVVALSGCGDDAPSSADSSSTGAASESGPSTSASTSAGTEDSTTDPDGSTSTTSTGSIDTSGEDSSTTSEPVCDDLPQAITAAGIQTHLEAFAQIAADNGGNRGAGTPGHEASAAYVREQLEAAGYTAAMQEFEVSVFTILGPSMLEWVDETTYTELSDFQVAQYSAGGSATATAHAVDVALGLGNTSDSGCQEGDFDGFPSGGIAVIQRGDCFLWQKVLRAEAAGAVGVIIFNQGDTAGDLGLFNATLGTDVTISIPVVLSTYALGETLAQQPDGSVTISLTVNADVSVRSTANVVVETANGDPDDVLMLGAHLDSVPTGPGINDNATGSAALLEIARMINGCEMTRKVRFAWWSAEEVGLVGSEFYVDSLDAMSSQSIGLYINLDMIGSPNYVRFRYDGDGSRFGSVGPMGSAELEQVFADWFDGLGLATEETTITDGRSDHAPFIDVGIAAGGLAAGAEGIKTEEQAAVYGGAAGEPYDACYHQSCDDLENVDLETVEAIAGATAHAVELYALD